MLAEIGSPSLEALMDETVPPDIRLRRPLALPEPTGERELLDELRERARHNKVFRSFIGMGYHGCITPPVIQRNVTARSGSKRFMRDTVKPPSAPKPTRNLHAS